jgi:hypothetical protein
MDKLKELFSAGKKLAEQATEIAVDTSKSAKEYWDENKDEIQSQGKEAFQVGKEYLTTTYQAASDAASSIYHDIKFSDSDITKLQQNIENQGGYYRELNRRSTTVDSIMLGGETLGTLLAAGTISDEIIRAYEAAYPDLAEAISFEDKVRELDADTLTGFISGVKGKLFEQKYVGYLNDGNLPDGYVAVIAESATQPGWDISIEGANGEIASVLQAKATDSVSYVKDAIEKYPNIDVVTTDEVYSHLVMSGVSENISNSAISNVELIDVLDNAVDASELTMDYTPPVFALAFIAFTSYKDDSLTLYEKARTAGDRSGKTYLSYLVGGGVAAITNTWWLGVLGSVSSRIFSDSGNKKYETYKKLLETERGNQRVINKLIEAKSN